MKRFIAIVFFIHLAVISMDSQVYQLDSKMETATLGGGCFWCLEAVFEQVNGVKQVVSGYAGGNVENPDYQDVCSGSTGHAEVVQVTFNPLVISYADLLELFFAMHDPTTLNRQGADVGTQYRSVIFYHSSLQQETAQQKIREINQRGDYQGKIVTEIKPITVFYKAEAYHQNYFVNHPNQPYCRIVISPKVEKFKKQYKGF
jgi:peptide-methionine (S)-S-oxide reductase